MENTKAGGGGAPAAPPGGCPRVYDRLVSLGALVRGFRGPYGDFRQNRPGRRDSDLATLIRTLVILVVLGSFISYTGRYRNPWELQAKTWVFLILSGMATGASWVCYFRALKIGEASKVAPVDKLSLVLVALFAVLFLGERPVAREWLGILLVAVGVFILALK